MIGACGFFPLALDHRRGEIAYVLGRPYWNQGYMTEAVRAVIGFGFQQLGLNRIEAMCDPENIGSYRVLEKSGMLFEGILRQHLFVKGAYRDVRLYAVLRQDWSDRPRH